MRGGIKIHTNMDAVRTLLHSTVVLNNDGTDDGSTYAGLAGLPAVYSLTPQLANGEDDVLSNAGQAAVPTGPSSA